MDTFIVGSCCRYAALDNSGSSYSLDAPHWYSKAKLVWGKGEINTKKCFN